MYREFQNENRLFIISCIVIASIFAIFGFGFGTVFLAGITLYITIWVYIRKLAEKYSKLFYLRILKSTMLVIFAVWMISFLILEGAIIANDQADRELNGDYLLVLGAGLRGEMPSVSLRSRLDKALEFLTHEKDMKVIVSGGQGSGESITEAEAMKRYLAAAGIDESRIIKEDRSSSTKENLVFSKAILEDLHNGPGYKLILITSDFHMYRTKLLAGRIGLDIAVLSSDTPLTTYINYSIREYFAIIKMYLDK